MTAKIDRFLAAKQPQTPCLVVDLDVVAERYGDLRQALPAADIYYAVKANPATPVLEKLVQLGANFDAASLAEIRQCLACGARPDAISFGNTIKRKLDIATAHDLGVGLYAFDSALELEKLAAAAPGARVYCRILLDDSGAAWPLNRKFGCSLVMANDLMLQAKASGLAPYGLSFHVGSQQTDRRQWEIAIGQARMVFTSLQEAGLELQMLNLGGGFPARYRGNAPDLGQCTQAISEAVSRNFGNRIPRMIIEPGRYIAADAGVLRSEVLLISTKSDDDPTRWVFVDIGKFGGLAETIDEAIQYRLRTARDGGETGPVVLAGPTCDGADILYEHAGYRLPLDLQIGDRVDFLSAGAYTATYASVGFNGIPPLAEHYL